MHRFNGVEILAAEKRGSWGYKSAMLILDTITYYPVDLTMSERHLSMDSDFVNEEQYLTFKNMVNFSYKWEINDFTTMNLRDIFNDVQLYMAIKDPSKLPDYRKQINKIMSYMEDIRRWMLDD